MVDETHTRWFSGLILSRGGGLIAESLEESAAAYTKATAKKCILEKVDVKTGEEAESNVLQVSARPYSLDHGENQNHDYFDHY